MTIAIVMRPEEGHKLDPSNGFRHKLKWIDKAFVGEEINLMGGPGTTNLSVGVSQFGDAMILSTWDDREAHLLGCLFSEQP